MEFKLTDLKNLMSMMPGAAAVYQARDEGFMMPCYSDGLPEMLGFTAAEYKSRVAGDNMGLIVESDRAYVRRMIVKAVDGEYAQCSYRVFIGGGYHWMRGLGHRIGELDGYPVILAEFSDTTQETEMHEQLLDQANDAIYVCDTSTYELFYLNEKARAFWGVGNDYTGKTCYRFLRGWDRPCPWCPIGNLENERYSLEHEGGPNDDRFLHVDYRALAWYGRPSLCATLMDMTGERDARKELAQAEHELDKIVDSIPSGIGIFDVVGDTITLTYLNDGYYRMMDVDRNAHEGFTSKNAVMAIHPDDMAGIIEEAKRSMAENRLFDHVFRILAGNGEYRWVSVRASHEPTNDRTERFYAAYFDIDELVRTQDQLADSKADLERILGSIPAAIGIYRKKDDKITIDRVNRNMRDVTGNPEDELTKADFDDLLAQRIHPDDLAKARNGFLELFSPSHEATFVYRNRVESTGEYRWLQCRGRSFPQTDGTQIAYAVFADITESAEARQSAEQQLANEKLRMQSLQGNILAASCFNVSQDRNIDLNNDENLHYSKVVDEEIENQAKDADPRIGDQRRETKDVLLYAAEQIPDAAQRREFIRTCSHMGMMEAYEQGKRQLSIDYRRQTGKGLIWVNTRIELVPDPQSGDILGFFYTTDINERKIEQLIDQRVIQDDYEYIGLIDIPTREIQTLNVVPVAREISFEGRMDHDRALLSVLRPSIDADEQDDLMRALKLDNIVEALENQHEFLRTLTVTDTAGRHHRKQLRYAYLDETKDLIFITGADITESTKLEQEQQERLKDALHAAKAANAAKSDFLARMSHDIRTPLNGVIGMTGLALDETDPAAIHDYLGKIDESGKFLLSLVNDILDVAKVESGTIELHQEHYPYPEFRQYIVSIIEPLCESKNIEFSMTEAGMYHTILTDRLRLNQIVFNLLSNAVKYTPRGGHVWFHVENHQQLDGGIIAEITVRDDGIGMSEDFQKHLFEPFVQEHTAINDPRTGTGLGLSIVKELVNLMHGTIEVESAPNEGSTFKVTMPVDPAPDIEEPPATAEAPFSFDGMHILTAEDNAINAEIAMRLLEKHHADVTIASDGERALRQFAESEQYYFDAVLMDVRMPNMDGLRATQAIRALDRPDAKIVPIIAMTANAFDDDIRECLDAGMDAHIAKPIDPTKLFQTLGRQIRREEPYITDTNKPTAE